MRLTGKVALITGAGSGIGRETALLFAREGAGVVVVDVNDAAGQETVRMLESAGGQAIAVRADVSRAADCEHMVRAAEQRFVWRVGLRLLSQGIDRVHALTDYTQYGGSPILGFDRLFIKCHGRSNQQAVANAVKVAAKAVRDRVPTEVRDALARMR